MDPNPIKSGWVDRYVYRLCYCSPAVVRSCVSSSPSLHRVTSLTHSIITLSCLFYDFFSSLFPFVPFLFSLFFSHTACVDTYRLAVQGQDEECRFRNHHGTYSDDVQGTETRI
mmetsp:Transcript_44278/g.44929  ORF Transcript_44278/g.44929 Transcript_44278/m.44929 type:complete len:113 (+) Transcript_44278:1097-1435(+)